MRKLLLLAVLAAAPACISTTKTFSPGGGGIPKRPASATYPNWEYFCMAIGGGFGAEGNVNDMLVSAGGQGWELVNYADALFCFKRPVPMVAKAPTPSVRPSAAPSAAPVAPPSVAPVAPPSATP